MREEDKLSSVRSNVVSEHTDRCTTTVLSKRDPQVCLSWRRGCGQKEQDEQRESDADVDDDLVMCRLLCPKVMMMTLMMMKMEGYHGDDEPSRLMRLQSLHEDNQRHDGPVKSQTQAAYMWDIPRNTQSTYGDKRKRGEKHFLSVPGCTIGLPCFQTRR